ncbi:MAG: sigma-70 family RNA polymerase sigma factor, partial [Thermomicrobiales bacterium]
ATLVPHPDSEQAVDDVLTGVIHEQIRRSLETLTERERTVLMLRFGLNGPQPQTLAEIAKRLGVSRERVRQIEQDALGRLRRSDLRGLANGLA